MLARMDEVPERAKIDLEGTRDDKRPTRRIATRDDDRRSIL